MSGLYGYRWQVRSKRFLAAHPLCIMCQRQGRPTAATVVDHIVRHKGNVTLFWDETNWQPLCKPHHDRTKQRVEIHGYSNEVDPSTGLYRDPRHPSNIDTGGERKT